MNAPINVDDRAQAVMIAARLRAQRALGYLALVVALAGVMVVLSERVFTLPAMLAFVAIVLTVIERYFMARLDLDRALFDAWSRGDIDGAGIDRALVALRFVKQAPADRPLAERIAGALRLQRSHTRTVIAQVVLLLLALMTLSPLS